MPTYYEICQTPFWQTVFNEEYKYLFKALAGCKKILSVGCGPAEIERMLVANDFAITGLDISKEALNYAPDSIRKIVGTAEMIEFPDETFDAVIYVASLQFIQDYKKAITETAKVLIKNGKLIVMLLNPESSYFKMQMKTPESYMQKIKHINLSEIENVIVNYFDITSEYYLGIVDEKIFANNDPKIASLYILNGIKKL